MAILTSHEWYGFGMVEVYNKTCWWLIDGVLCEKRLMQDWLTMSYRCKNGHPTTEKELQERKYGERVEK